MKKIILAFVLIFSFSYAKESQQTRLQAYEKFVKVVNIIEKYYVERLDTNQIVEKLLKGGIARLDAHSSFLDKKGICTL